MGKAIKRIRTPEEHLLYRARVDRFKFEYDAKRAEATRRLVSFRYLRGDLHTHSRYSDGWGEIADNWAVAQARGLDFMFATDHETIRQKIECRKFRGVWWGQEPGTEHHHLCILGLERKFKVSKNLKIDIARLHAMGVFFYFPHPCGWYPRQWYSPEAVNALEEAGAEFAIEVMNGIFRTEAFHDEWTEANVAIWDRYLSQGRRVIGLGATDAHMPATVGNVWTGVIGARLDKASVLKALRNGRAFASSGPAILLRAEDMLMGGVAHHRQGKIKIAFECADAYGLNWARVICDGCELKRFEYRGRPHALETLTLRLKNDARYVRVECAANDDRRAYANPIYFITSRGSESTA